MDHYGIGAAMHGMARVYFQSARRTGRTISLIESVKDGDRIVFSNSDEMKRVKRLCMERGLKLDYLVLDPKDPTQLWLRQPSEGRTIFDHSWIEQRYLNALESTQQEIDYYEREASGHGAAHRETKRRAEEIMKWEL